MDCLMIFNHLNDLVYKKFNASFQTHILELAFNQGLIQKSNVEELDDNVLIQLFSPIVSSHHIMHYQFGNSYSSVQFADDLQLQFSEFMGFLFISITKGDKVDKLMDTYVTMAKYLCGPDFYQLQTDSATAPLYTRLIDKWISLRNKEQSILVEAIEQMIVNQDISAKCLQTLKESISKLSAHEECSRVHALLFVGIKFLSLYSSANAKQLNPGDMLFLSILAQCIPDEAGTIHSFKVCLSSGDTENKSSPHSVHVIRLFEEVFLMYVVEEGDSLVSASLYESFLYLHKLRFIQVQREKESIKLGFENLEIAVKRLNDGLKKCKVKAVVNAYKQLTAKWDVLRSKYKEYLKSSLDEAILRAETLSVSFLDNLKELYSLTASDDTVLKCSSKHITDFIPKVTADLVDFGDYFKVKRIKNFTLGSYLEEFPGLVHFLYLDRNTHRLTSPSLDMDADKAEFIQERVWSMIDFARSHLQHGHMAIIWKDKIFTYGYFSWFEDSSGEPLKIPISIFKFAVPGILGEDFYAKLKTALFPKTSPGKIRIYELYVMHLGLMPASAVLEQSRMLSSTVWELKGFPTHAIDLL